MTIRNILAVSAIASAALVGWQAPNPIRGPECPDRQNRLAHADVPAGLAWLPGAGAIPSGWRLDQGTLAKDKPVADIVTKDEFGDFEFEFDWKIGEAGNAGSSTAAPRSTTTSTGARPSTKLLDDIKRADDKTRLTCAGSGYALYPSPAGL